VTESVFSNREEKTERLYLALWLPHLATERLTRERRSSAPASGGPADRPLVLVEKVRGALRIAALDPRALALGLTPGLTLADARARVPDLGVQDVDPVADQACLERLADSCDRYTPLVALDPPHGLVLDVSGCAHLFGGEAALRADLGAWIAQQGFTSRMAMASTPEAARALSRFARKDVAQKQGATVRALPVAALETEPETILALSRAGLKTVGAVADLPSTALTARFGAGLSTRLRRLLGEEDARITPRRTPPLCMVERRFQEPIARQEDIEATLARLIASAARVLEQRGEGGRVFVAGFHRSDGQLRLVKVETGQPSRDPAALLRLYRERLEVLTDPLDPGFGYDLIRVSVVVAEPMATEQVSLDGRMVDDRSVVELVDRLVARFGRERVLRFTAQDSHHPERACGLAPALEAPETAGRATWPRPEPDAAAARPLQLFNPPQPIETLAEVPDGPPLRFRWRRVLHEVARAEGPERIAPEWWREARDEPTRDYYRVEDAHGRRFWLFRAGLYGRETDHPRWFLHGLFA